jgi:menaquinone-dependent protoporphyrinogen IX oxidase
MKKQDTKQKLFEMMSKIDSTYKPRLNENIVGELNNPDFLQWKEKLINVIMNDDGSTRDEIAITDKEVFDYFKQGKTPEEVYNDIWQKDAGNYYNIGGIF